MEISYFFKRRLQNIKPEGGEERRRLLAKKESFLKENVFKE